MSNSGNLSYGRPTQYGFIDSFGPPRNLSAQTADGSWVDCFAVMAPAYKMGFLTPWWSETKNRPATHLGLAQTIEGECNSRILYRNLPFLLAVCSYPRGSHDLVSYRQARFCGFSSLLSKSRQTSRE